MVLVQRTIQPDASVFKRNIKPSPLTFEAPQNIAEELQKDRVIVKVDGRNATGGTTWGLAPIYNAGGQLIGGLLIQPLTNSIDQQFEGTYRAFYNAIIIVIALSLFTALLHRWLLYLANCEAIA